MNNDRFFDSSPDQRAIARQLYQTVVNLPLVCPHGHVDPRLFADPDYRFGNPAELFITSDHYVMRMLYCHGIPLEVQGIPSLDNSPVETDPRRIWQIFADNYHIFRGTPSGVWLNQEFFELFGITQKLNSATAQDIYDQITAQLTQPEFQPRRLYEKFNVEFLCTTDSAIDTLAHHQAIRESDWEGRILPTFRPDTVIKIDAPNWAKNIETLSEVSSINVVDYRTFLQALENRRAFFKQMGAVATDHDIQVPSLTPLSAREASQIFAQGLNGPVDEQTARRFNGHMLTEMARMSVDDGLVMQLHAGSYRNHNHPLWERFGPDIGGDLPVRMEYTRNLKPLLNRFGNHPNFRLIIFTLDESAYTRELAPLAGHYPALKLGPPWWFNDSVNGIRRYLNLVVETTGIYKTAGFSDDTRALPSLPVRHDVWRRVTVNWLAGLVVQGIIDEEDAAEMAHTMAYDLAKEAYRNHR